MLHTNTVTAEVLQLISKLQGKPYLEEFYLVGETGLALQIGHRKYFQEVNLSDWPVIIANDKLSWKEICNRIEAACRHYIESLNA